MAINKSLLTGGFSVKRFSTHELQNMVIEINSMMPALKQGQLKFNAGVRLKMARGELKHRQASR